MKVLVTGGAGFIGSAVIRHLILNENCSVVNVDKLTYAGNLDSLNDVSDNSLYNFECADICDYKAIDNIFYKHKPDKVMHLAAESHVDRSINGSFDFINTNIIGTYQMLEVSRKYFSSLDSHGKSIFRFHHISTDEVFGDLHGSTDLFEESTPYSPSSPYSASKASSDHLVRSWFRTYGLPIVITNCSNNYGPYHFPEKLIPLTILNAIHGKPLPVYGDGTQVRDWLYVDDHARALTCVLFDGIDGDTYNIGGHNEVRNIDVVTSICDILEELLPNKPIGVSNYRDLISFVNDRPGHDFRYAINASKIENLLGWTPSESFDTGLRKTVQWFINNKNWWHKLYVA